MIFDHDKSVICMSWQYYDENLKCLKIRGTEIMRTKFTPGLHLLEGQVT